MKRSLAVLMTLCIAGGAIPAAYATNACAVDTSAAVTASDDSNTRVHPEDAVITFDFGTHEAKPGDTVKVAVMVKTYNNPVIAMDVTFDQDTPIKLTKIGANSPAFDRAEIQSNVSVGGCNFASKNADGDGILPDESLAVFNLTYEIPSNCPGGEYKIGFGSKCEVYIDNSAWNYKTETIGGTIKVDAPANENNYNLGDVNNDGTVDGSDATLVLREFGNLLADKGASFTPEQFAAGDVDKNGVIDGSDATLILRFYGAAGNDVEISYAGMEPWMEKNFWNNTEA